MADLYIGSQGSGKSARAVKSIIDGLDSYTFIYTNIDVKEHEKINKLRFKDFSEDYIRPCYKAYQEDELYGDENLVNLLMEKMGIENVSYNDFSILLVLDEASNYYKEKNSLFRWFIEYHRHLNIDFILITQLETSIHLDNRIYNNIYEAWGTSRQVIPFFFIYTHYIGRKVTNEYKKGMTLLYKDKKIFNFYVSGRQKKEKNVIAFPVFMLFLLLYGVYYGFNWFLGSSSLTAKQKEPKQEFKNLNYVGDEITEIKKNDLNNTENIKYDSIYSYFVDENNLYCESDLKSIPLILVPKDTILIREHGYKFYRYYYDYELKFCKKKVVKKTALQQGIQHNIDEL